MALLSIPSTPTLRPPALSRNAVNRKQIGRLFLNTIPWKRPRLLFLVSIISQDPESICACTEYICVRDIYYIRLNGLNKEPLASGYNPITAGLALSLSLSPLSLSGCSWIPISDFIGSSIFWKNSGNFIMFHSFFAPGHSPLRAWCCEIPLWSHSFDSPL